MTRHPKAGPATVLACAAITLVACALLGATAAPSEAGVGCGGILEPPCTTPTTPTTVDTTTETTETTTSTTEPTTTTTQPPQWEGSRWTGPTANGETVTDGTFSGTFVNAVAADTISGVDLNVIYSPTDVHAPACGDGEQTLHQSSPSTSSTTPSTTGSPSSSMSFLFEVAFTCNGIYDTKAEATTEAGTKGELSLSGLHIAVPPPPPLSLSATDNGDQTVTLAWQHPNHPPVDTIGYRISRRPSASQSFTPIVDTEVDATTYTDTKYSTGGGSFVFKVETLRRSPNGTLVSVPVVTDGALEVSGVERRGTSGGTVGGTVPPNSGGSGAQFFDPNTTLPGDDFEDGEVSAGTVQRFAGDDGGAGLVTPFAGALNLGVWAGLLLFLTRRAASAERALASVELEHSP